LCGGLRYLWSKNCLLSRAEAEYGLARLWERVAGDAGWAGEPVLTIPAVDESFVRTMFAMSPGDLTWISLIDVTPPGMDLGLDTDRLPAICQDLSVCPVFHNESPSFPLDLVAATFLLLSRWEEYSLDLPRDIWGNVDERTIFPSRQGFLERPVLDEWALVLRSWLQAIRPGWQARPSSFRIVPTHDIDHLFRYPRISCLPRRLVGTAVRTRSIRQTVTVAREGVSSLKRPDSDPCVQLVRNLADRDEALGLQGAFFFMTALAGPSDDGYDISGPVGQRLLRELNDRGHVLGWHSGYRAAEDQKLFHEQAACFRSVVADGASALRMHYLRWRKHTPEWMETLGFSQDYSWGLNDLMGFSHGTAIPFVLWDVERCRSTTILETPLLVQDGAFARIAGDERQEAVQTAKDICGRAKRVGGVFSFLMHNNPHCGRTDYASVADALYGCLE
jgi:uncharacterized protein DUF7033